MTHMTTYTLIHVVLSLAAIAAGIFVVLAMFANKKFDMLTLLFLVATGLTSLTGFGFVRHHFMPSHAAGIVALLVLAPTVFAYHKYRLAGAWLKVYIVGAIISLYLNVFVLIVQAFLKIPKFHALAPTQHELIFKFVQGWTLVFFVAICILALLRFHPAVKKSGQVMPARMRGRRWLNTRTG